MYARLLGYLVPYRRRLVAYVAVTLAVAVLGLLTPWPMKILVDSVLGSEALPAVFGLPVPSWLTHGKVALLVAVVASGVVLKLLLSLLQVWETSISIRVRQAIVLRLKSDLFQHLQLQSFSFFDSRRLGDLLYRVNTDVWGVDELILTLMPLLVACLKLGGMMIVIAYLNWQLALLSLLIVPFFYATYLFYSKHFDARVEEVQRLEGETMSTVQEVLGAQRMVKAFNREEHEHARFLEQSRSAKKARVRLTTQQVTFSAVVGLITVSGTSLVLGVGGYQVLAGVLTLGELLVVLAYLGSVYEPLASIHTAAAYTHGYVAKIRRLLEIFDAEPEIRDRPNAVELGRAAGAVVFDRVSFSYAGGRHALHDVSLEVRPGESVGIVGATGAGKSTLVSLIPRFYDPTTGRVLLDGRDVRDIRVKSLRRQVSIVMQDSILLTGTIRENISYGRPEATFEEITRAARMAGAHDFIAALPEGYESEVGERGVKLSGGERQRISIARAFLRDAPILIFDEPTSAVDYQTEAAIMTALQRLMAGRTTLIIAHRLSTLDRVDRIVALSEGRVAELGTRDELLASRGLYYQLTHVAGGAAGAGGRVSRAEVAS